MNYDKTNTDILYCKTRVSPIAYIPADKAGTYRPDAQTSQYGIKLPFRVDSYTAEEPWGKGGMSETYKGKDEQGNEVIIKIPKYDPDIEKRFLSECTILRKLDSPYIAKWLADGVQELQGQPRPYLVMSFVHGQTLRQRITSNQHTPWNDVSAMLENIAKALKHLHEQGYCHRDIKPENLIYDQDNGRWVLVDFGIAHENRPEHLLLTLLQNDGTWNYMSPEQQTNKASDIRSDIYALGTCAWEALIGTLPQRGTALPSKYELNGKLAVNDVSSEVDNLIEMMTEHHPEDRFQTPDDLLLALKTTSSLVKAKLIVERKWKRWLKLIIFAISLAALLSGGWFVGDGFYERKLKDIASKNIRASIKLHKIEAMYRPFFWGKTWYSSNIDILREKARTEKIRMGDEYQSLKTDYHSHTISYDDKVDKCLNFIQTWEGAADSYEMIQEVKRIRSDCEYHLKHYLKLDEIYKKLENAGDDYEKKLEILKELKDINIHDTEANKRREETVEEITNNTFNYINNQIQENASKSFENACRILQHLITIVGDNAKTSEHKKKLLNMLLKGSGDGTVNLISLKHKLDIYEHYFGKNDQTIEVKKNFDKIIQDAEWEETHKRANELAEKQNNFTEAKSLIAEFEKKYPEFPKYLISQAKLHIASIYVNTIEKLFKEYDTCKHSVALFFDHFSSVSSDKLKQRVHVIMFNAAVWRIVRIYLPEEIKKYTPEKLHADITKDNWEYCTNEHKAFLREIQTLAQKGEFKELFYRLERHPEIWGSNQLDKIMYKVTINKITVHLSPEYYNRIKGSFDCDPRVVVHICDLKGNKIGDPIISELGAVNAQVFIIHPKKTLYLDTRRESLVYVVEDADFYNTASIKGLYNPAPKELYSRSNPKHILDWSKWGDSTRMYVDYTVE